MVKRRAGALLLSLAVDRESTELLANQLSSRIRALILNGDLAPGERLPASRTLARELGVSRTTVVEVFERLAAEGLIESRTGAGSFVSALLDNQHSSSLRDNSAAAGAIQPRLSSVMRSALGRFAQRIAHDKPQTFVTSLPSYADFPMSQWSRKVAKHWREQRGVVLSYGEPQGHYPLRRSISQHLRANRGVSCEPEQVFVVGGAQQAFQLIAHVLLDAGDKVWMENPGAIGLRNALIASGAQLVPVPVDEEGIDVAAGLAAAADFRMALVTPSHQHPTAITLSLERRLSLLRAAEAAGAMIVEDDYDGEFYYRGRPPPALKSLDTRGVVVYVGTFSKTLFPALRIGYMVVPPSLVDVFDKITHAFLQGNPSNLQAVVADFIDSGDFSTHVRRMSTVYAERHDTLCDRADEELRGYLQLSRPHSGLNTVGWLRQGLDEAQVVAAAAAQGVTVAGVNRYCLTPVQQSGVTMGFSGFSSRDIKAGVLSLRKAFESLSS